MELFKRIYSFADTQQHFQIHAQMLKDYNDEAYFDSKLLIKKYIKN